MAAPVDLIRRLLYPPDAVCLSCGALRVDDTRGLCAACAETLTPLEGPFCPLCGEPGDGQPCLACMLQPAGALDGVRSAYAYEGTARQLIRALKYGSVHSAADALADGIVAAAGDLLPGATLVPVPLHRRRQRMRGFNQAEVLARAIAARSGNAVSCALARDRSTRTQTRFSREERARNVSGAFSALPRAAEGLSFLLVDDVYTTGATAAACAQALKAAGASRVVLLAAAKAFSHRDA